MSDGTFKFIFESGVVRFDASDNLFVHMRHSKTDAHPITVDDGMVSGLPETERRGRFLGSGSGAPTGAFKTTDDLIRGFTIEVKGYTSAVINGDGHLEVDVDGVVDSPNWASGTSLRLGRDGDALRLWAKSSFPEGVTEGDGSAPAPKPKAKKGSGPGPKKPPAEPAKTFNAPEKADADPAKEEPTKKKASAKKKAPAKKKAAAKKAAEPKAAKKEATPEAKTDGAKPKTESMAKARGDKSPNAAKVGATGVKAEGGKSKTTVDTTPRTAGSKSYDPGGKKKSGGGCALMGGVMLMSIFAAATAIAAIL